MSRIRAGRRLRDRLEVAVGGTMIPFVPVTGSRIRRRPSRALVLEDLLEVRRARADGTGSGCPAGQRYVRVEQPDDTGNARLGGPAAGSPVSVIAPAVAPW
jgi:hypothetical protein